MSDPADHDTDPFATIGRTLYRILCHIAHCDGEVHPHEWNLLQAYRDHFGIGLDEAEDLEAMGAQSEEFGSFGEHEKAFAARALADVIAADGRLDENEVSRLSSLAGPLGLDVEAILADVRERLEDS